MAERHSPEGAVAVTATNEASGARSPSPGARPDADPVPLVASSSTAPAAADGPRVLARARATAEGFMLASRETAVGPAAAAAADEIKVIDEKGSSFRGRGRGGGGHRGRGGNNNGMASRIREFRGQTQVDELAFNEARSKLEATKRWRELKDDPTLSALEGLSASVKDTVAAQDTPVVQAAPAQPRPAPSPSQAPPAAPVPAPTAAQEAPKKKSSLLSQLGF